MAVLKLNTTTSEDFVLWGLLTGFAGHRICWQLNKHLPLHFTRAEDICLEREAKAPDAYFSYYRFDDEENGILFELIGNKANGEFYMRELKNFDFLLMIKGELDFFEVADFAKTLKQLPAIQSAMPINLTKLKQLSHLILE